MNANSRKYGSLQLGPEISDNESLYGFIDEEIYADPSVKSVGLVSSISYATPIVAIVILVTVFMTISTLSESHSSISRNTEKSFNSNTSKVSTSKKPHFVVFLADDLAWNSMGTTDESLTYVTPTLTSLAQQGIFMENFYAQEVCKFDSI